jgi:antirestriction protein
MPRSIGVLLGESINFKSLLKLINMTKLQNCLDTASIYCGTYAKYNNGSLYGKWLNLADYSDYDSLLTAMYELHSDEADPEFMFQDYECPILEKLGLLSECHISKDICDVLEQINYSGHDVEVYEACLDCLGNIDFQSLYEYVNNFYYGEFESDEDFVQWLYEDDTFNIPNWVVIDWSATARSIMFDYFESNGHYFRS